MDTLFHLFCKEETSLQKFTYQHGANSKSQDYLKANNCYSFAESCEDQSSEESPCDRLTFYHFDISRLLKHGASLLGSAGVEFELQDDKTGL